VLNVATLERLGGRHGRGASCRIYPKPLGAALGTVNMFAADSGAERKVSIVISLYPLHHEHETTGVYVPLSAIRAINFRLDGTEKRYSLHLN